VQEEQLDHKEKEEIQAHLERRDLQAHQECKDLLDLLALGVRGERKDLLVKKASLE
jgi:hypothetical protein